MTPNLRRHMGPSRKTLLAGVIALCTIAPAWSPAHAGSLAHAGSPPHAGPPTHSRSPAHSGSLAHTGSPIHARSLARGAGSAASTAVRSPVGDARVIGTFAMSAHVTAARNVSGEHVGQLFARGWELSAQHCAGSICQSLALNRERSAGIRETLALRRTGPGVYTGKSSFYAALRCNGHVYPHGARAPYSITLAVAAAEAVQGIAFARQITATYVNSRRIDTTRCPLGPSHDAATYAGSASSPLPTPPVPSFTEQVDSATNSATFADTSAPGAGGAPIVALVWSFGDPTSGAADSSTEAAPTHQFTQPGLYPVALTVTDANGLTATITVPVQV